MDLDLQSLFGLHVHSQLYSFAEIQQTPQTSRIWVNIRGPYWSVKIDDPSKRLLFLCIKVWNYPEVIFAVCSEEKRCNTYTFNGEITTQETNIDAVVNEHNTSVNRMKGCSNEGGMFNSSPGTHRFLHHDDFYVTLLTFFTPFKCEKDSFLRYYC